MAPANPIISQKPSNAPLPSLLELGIATQNADGSVEIELRDDEMSEISGEEGNEPIETEFYDNLTFYLTEDELALIAEDVISGFDEDDSSRHGHIQKLLKGIDNLGLDDTNVETPFEGGCTVFHPLIMENAVKMQAKIEGELLPAKGPVRTQVLGPLGEQVELQALRVERHMNYQTTEVISEFYPNSQKTFLQTPLFGDTFRKNYPDLTKGRTCDTIIGVDKLVVNANTDSLENAERITEIQHISEREFLSRVYTGMYRDNSLVGEPYKIQKSEISEKIDQLLGLEGTGDGYEILEQHVYLDLPGFEDESNVPLPYIVCVETQSREVLSIRRNWDPDGGNKFQKREYYTQYGFVPGFGFYNLGYIHLLGNFQNTLTAIMRSLVDAGSFANLQGGFKSKAMRVLGEDEAIAPGEFRDVEFYGQDLSKAIYPFQFKEPSATLMAMFEAIEMRGQKYADSAEQVIADSTNYGPVGTTMALLDASTKFFTAVFKRFHHAQKKQLRIIAQLNYENLPDDPTGITFNIPGEEVRISKEDYDQRIDIIPVSDPNISSQAHRLTLASQKLQSALQAPQIHNLREIYKQFYIALGDEKFQSYLPDPQQPVPNEPVGDIMAAAAGQPIKAFPDQDHEAHIAVKTAFINDPSVAQNPLFTQALPAIQANIREHITMKFAQQLQGAGTLGLGAVEAAQQINEFNTWKAQNPLGTLDPQQLVAQAEMLKQENARQKLMLDQAALQEKAQKDTADAFLEMRKQDIEALKFQVQLEDSKEQAKFERALDFIKHALTTTGKQESDDKKISASMAAKANKQPPA